MNCWIGLETKALFGEKDMTKDSAYKRVAALASLFADIFYLSLFKINYLVN